MGQVLPFISKKEQERIKRELFLLDYLQRYVKDHEIVSMARMLGGNYTFNYTRTAVMVTFGKEEKQLVLDEVTRRNLTI
jgi:sugar diacid utilization regulator